MCARIRVCGGLALVLAPADDGSTGGWIDTDTALGR